MTKTDCPYPNDKRMPLRDKGLYSPRFGLFAGKKSNQTKQLDYNLCRNFSLPAEY
jgi:hypothetical protein